MSSGEIFMGGLALHPLVLVAVNVLVSGCRLMGFNPFSPTISIGRSPV